MQGKSTNKMKPIYTFALIALFLFSNAQSGEIQYQPVKGYAFVGDDQDMCQLFYIIHNEQEWNTLFKPYPGHYVKEITNIDWQKYNAIATVKTGKDAWRLEAKRLELDEGEFIFEYEAQKTDEGLGWKNATPLVIIAPKKNCRAVQFVENGRMIKKLHNFSSKRDF